MHFEAITQRERRPRKGLSRGEIWYLLERNRKRRRGEVESGNPLGNGLIGYWRLDETSGTAVDVGGVLNLSATNNPLGVTGKISAGRQFLRSSNQYLTVANHPSLALSEFTWAGWCKLTDKFNLYDLAGKTTFTGGQAEWELYYTTGADRFVFSVSPNGTSTVTVSASLFGSPSSQVWYYVAAWHDPAQSKIGISVNDLQNTAVHGSGMFNGTSPYSLGSRGEGTGLLNGVLDEVGLWNRVLTNEELTHLYNGGNGMTWPFG